ncbi:hypothetical protein BK120_30125 [Paenibacillus sp. FSL A5-0031]|uniref:TraX family protein n=1 Tax=Paenibacillus sp. FSL A5-0031 TaxID=1920420 RepID=UPI00096F6B41|nr:TraX family protein [Paenibacillus sp. FSL A5-0031]OME75924.1 hypothetical protein BK120_30125 [Paenibacillus sp. FSL A5-0031]
MQLSSHKIITVNILKVIAIVAMMVDHTSSWLVPKGTTLDIIIHTFGRLAAPIMCYLIAEGYFYTSNIKKYITRLAIFAVISHLPFDLYFDLPWWKSTSVIWGLLMGLVALFAIQQSKFPLILRIFSVLLCCMMAWTSDWNFIAVLWIVFFGIFRGRFQLQMVSFVTIGTIFYFIPIINLGPDYIYRFGILLVIPLLVMYNGKKGSHSNLNKWGFYVFYPVHLIALYILKYHIF